MSSTRTVQEVSTTEDLLVVRQEPQPHSIPGLGTIVPGQLTPSDLTVLNKMPWRSEEVNGVVRLQVKEPPQEVTKLALAAALRANDEAGAIRLEVVQEKVFFGLFTSTTLYVVRKDKAAQWPVRSLEQSLRVYPSTAKVSDVIYDWAGSDSYHPWREAGERILGSMVNRRLLDLEVVERRVLKLFTATSRHYMLPERTSALVTADPTGLPDALLIRAVENGINRRQIHTDYD